MAPNRRKPTSSIPSRLISAAEALRDETGSLPFSPPVTHVYRPLEYAWRPHRLYLERYGTGPKRVVFLGMNPGPFGMIQTGIPFGEISAVRDWLGIEAPVEKPPREHPKRPVEGFGCRRSEVSGLRLWGLFAQRFKTADRFFQEHFVANYCPLGFFEESGRNRTPDKLPSAERSPLETACAAHLRALLKALQPEWVIAVGSFAESRAQSALSGEPYRIGRILHPSPSSPAANRAWSKTAISQLEELGVWGS